MKVPDIQVLENAPEIMSSFSDICLIKDALVLLLQPDCFQSAFHGVEKQ